MAKQVIKTKADIVAAIADKVGITKAQAGAAIDELVAIAYATTKSEKEFTLPGLGKLYVTKQSARTAINLQTKEKIKVPAKNVVKFKVGKACKDAIVPPKKK